MKHKIQTIDIYHLYRTTKLGGLKKTMENFEKSNKEMSQFFEEKEFWNAYTICKIFDALKLYRDEDNYWYIKYLFKNIEKYKPE